MAREHSSFGRGRARGAQARRGQVLIILVGSLFFMGGSSVAVGELLTGKSTSKIDKAIEKHVKDEARCRQAKEVVKGWEKTAEEGLKDTNERQAKLLKLMVDRDAKRAQLDAEIAQIDAEFDASVKQVLAERTSLRTILTAEEWSAVFAQ